MSQQNSCNEKWLDDIVEVAIYKATSNSLGIPPAVPSLKTWNISSFNGFVIGMSITEKNNYELVNDASITAKITPSNASYGYVYTHEISLNVDGRNDNLSNIESVIHNEDCYVVLKCADGKSYLCYTLPHSFSLSNNVTDNNGTVNAVKISLKSRSEFIQLT